MRGSTARARARAVRCFWPPESVIPRSPTVVSKPCGKSWRSLASCATPAAHSEGSSPPRTPKATFSRTVAEKRKLSCGTKPTAPRSVSSGIPRTSWPSTKRVPGGASKSRGRRETRVLLPAPVGPTTATVVPAGTTRSMSRRTGSPS